MTTASTPTKPNIAGGFAEPHFDAFLTNRAEHAWLVQRRREALAKFLASPWPTLRDEEWRRTDIRGLKLDAFGAPSGQEPAAEAKRAFQPAYELLSGHYATGLEQIDGVPTRPADPAKLGSAVLVDLNSALKTHPELLQKYLLTDDATASADLFAALHAAYWTGGALLYVPKGVKVEAPLFHLIGLSSEGRTDLSHTLVVLEEGAEATLVQETAAPDRNNAPGLHVGAVELFIGRGAKLRFVNIQNWDSTTWHFSRERAWVGRDASLQWTVGGLGSRLAKVNQEVALTGQGAEAQVNGVMFTTGRQNLSYFTRQDHQAPHTTSDLLYKGVLKDQSRLVWKGMIRVEKDAQQTNGYQKNDNLMLSAESRADSIPGLEIEANDVRCTHGATAGPVDEEMVFYLESRGIGRETAVRLIVEGFFANVYDRITLEPVQETLRKAVAERLAL